MKDCPLCQGDGGQLLARSGRWRIIRADEAGFPAFYRVIWNQHVAEYTDLSPEDRTACMDVVAKVESLMRRHLAPTKINVASLGNVVPHLHWHVIARFDWDSHFPAPVWAAAQRVSPPEHIARLQHDLAALEIELAGLAGPA